MSQKSLKFAKFAGFSSAVSAFLTVAFTNFAFAFDQGMQDGAVAAKGVDQPADLFGAGGTFATVSNILLFIVGAVAVIMIIVGGLRYVTSGGDASSVSAAKNTILYAIVGIIVALLAYAAISFVIGGITGAGTSGGTNV